MKLISIDTSEHGLEELKAFLRQKGILVSSTNDYANASRYRTAARMKTGIWVHLDEQFYDAEKIISDPGHTPLIALSVEEMDRIEHEAKNTFFDLTTYIFGKITGWVLLISIVGLLLYMLFSFLKG